MPHPPAASRGVKHAAVYGDRRNDALATPSAQATPGAIVDGDLLLKHIGK
jgi:hypothetical protein